ncbi:DUF4181 domain-containing protein [Bacillus paramycoides]|uniref:DUF4181 domain-containing protein n=1 Tax=Bacillus paramycoides TaxID=2026194 RepID=A0ABU6MZ94_9BACI|nr:DUF4181 domain-containing protein [Bacillus paramycoides]MCW9132371.1 DUF4181 domain-containing protein [Bacillus paramycoides]MED0960698.1 DUF4181 domain-containing protein [Bacillus paramycoides]MED0970435.1 DUF4181 domain-containing protein [Bacillus paramycoides]MED0981091.1 DUF4181 domain-containing protein [Bacillus paramycoides]MED0984609.1 DUF4181 domain-containing protein [Bacillus paramycoides]
MFHVKVIILVLWIIFLIALEHILRKKLNIPKQKGWNNQYVNKSHKWGSRIIIFSYIVVLIICYSLSNPLYMGIVPFLFLITLYSFGAFMEWKYDRESREFLMSLGGTISLMITGLILFLLI